MVSIKTPPPSKHEKESIWTNKQANKKNSNNSNTNLALVSSSSFRPTSLKVTRVLRFDLRKFNLLFSDEVIQLAPDNWTLFSDLSDWPASWRS